MRYNRAKPRKSRSYAPFSSDSVQFVFRNARDSFHSAGRSMSGKKSVGDRYGAIIADLTPQEVASVWSAVLFGRQSFDNSLSGAITALQALRNDRVALTAERDGLIVREAAA